MTASAVAEVETLSTDELVALAADDSSLYGEVFFPKTCRQATPPFHIEMWDDMSDPAARQVAFEVFRGGAKTSILRLFASKQIAYAVSRTILFVGKSQEHAVFSVDWLMRNVKFNRKWANTYGLRVGQRQAGHHLEIFNEVDQTPIRILALGMEGSIRGVNIEDYRPDLILVDDPCDEENTATPVARKKTSALFFGALVQSLAPASEAPLATIALAQTPLNEDDLISQCVRDPSWRSKVFSCFDENGDSRWPARWSTAELLAEKQQYIDRNQLSVWLREKECTIVSEETSAFLPAWLKYWEVLPEGGITIIAVDPTPPPREGAQAAASRLDDAAVVVLRLFRGSLYVCETYVTKSPDPLELIAKMFELAYRWGPIQHIAVESILFARVLSRMLSQEMARRRQWMVKKEVEDRRKKETRIRQEISRFASNGRLYVHRSMRELVEQFIRYPDVNHEDLLDAIAVGLTSLDPWMLASLDAVDSSAMIIDESAYPKLEWKRAP